jgi:hypothetical protein
MCGSGLRGALYSHQRVAEVPRREVQKQGITDPKARTGEGGDRMSSLVQCPITDSCYNPHSARARRRSLIEIIIGALLAFLFLPLPESTKFSVPSDPKGDISLSASPWTGTEQVHLSARVLLRLEQGERAESNPHYRDDIRIAWITCLYAWRGEKEPHVLATYRVLGLHPNSVWAAIEARRHARLGADCQNFYGQASSPKKPVQSSRRGDDRKDQRA